ncbi:hypothetical protein JCM16161A_16740 [Vulcanisaeta sp. JCM 16161]
MGIAVKLPCPNTPNPYAAPGLCTMLNTDLTALLEALIMVEATEGLNNAEMSNASTKARASIAMSNHLREVVFIFIRNH